MSAPIGTTRGSSFTTSVSAGAASGSAPTLSTEGIELVGGKGYRVTVAADSGQTLSGAGTVDCYLYSETISAWCRNPSLDIAIAVTAATTRGQVEDFESPGPSSDRVLYVPNGVTVSGGSDVTVVIGLRTAA